jgi:hypothetical protein
MATTRITVELTEDQVEAADLPPMPGLRQHGHVFVGAIAVRCYKHKARWTYDERDNRAAGRAFAELEGAGQLAQGVSRSGSP